MAKVMIAGGRNALRSAGDAPFEATGRRAGRAFRPDSSASPIDTMTSTLNWMKWILCANTALVAGVAVTLVLQ